jgi:hypothetical protein
MCRRIGRRKPATVAFSPSSPCGWAVSCTLERLLGQIGGVPIQ